MPPERYVWQGQRDENIAATVEVLVQALLDNYRLTDPANGAESERRKYEIALQTIDIWWMLYDKLVFWAQSQIVGSVWASDNTDMARMLGRLWGLEEPARNSHLMEYFGEQHGRIKEEELREPIDEYLREHVDLLDRFGLTDSEWRSIVIELLSSWRAQNSFWRPALAEGLDALNSGYIVEWFTPSQKRRRASTYDTLSLRAEALYHVNFLVGQGIKKYIALDRIAAALNTGSETLRTWEKEFKREEFYRAKAYAAQLAGRFEEDIRADKVREFENEGGEKDFRGKSYWNLASDQYFRIRNTTLEYIRDQLNAIRRWRKDGG